MTQTFLLPRLLQISEFLPRMCVMNLRPSILRILALAALATAGACRGPAQPADLGQLYNRAAQASDLKRNPVILVPGILGSRLYDDASSTLVWGAFSGEFSDPETPEGARLIALPLSADQPLENVRDNVRPDGALDSLRINLAGLPLTFAAYRNILQSLGVGGFRDQVLGEAGRIDYGGEHFTCFQFDYDWRRDNVENAKRLHRFILEKKAYVRGELQKRYGTDIPGLKFDIVAHSMGGLVTRYYLRYGDADLPAEKAPAITWAGARHVERVILVGTPNAGSVSAIERLVNGAEFAPLTPRYEPAILGTMPSIYQLLPRARHNTIVAVGGRRIRNLLEPALWKQMGWGLAAKDQDRILARLLPDVSDPAERRNIALAHLAKVLRRAERFQEALDADATPPSGLEIHLVAGDAEPTSSVITASRDGRVEVSGFAPGDGTVTRASALMDERLGGQWTPRLRTPIAFTSVRFIFADHLGLTKDPAFTDNMLYLLLEAPRLRGDIPAREERAQEKD